MKVYIVHAGDYEQRMIYGVFATREQAEVFADTLGERDIEEWEVKDTATQSAVSAFLNPI